MSSTRVALVFVAVLCWAGLGAAPFGDPAPSVWPVDTGWSRDFPVAQEFSLAITDSRLLVVEPAQVTAYDWVDGTSAWVSDLAATANPVAGQGRVFVPAGGLVHAVSEATGQAQWTLPTGRVSFSPAARSGWLVVADEDRILRGVSTSDGRMIWQTEIPESLVTSVVIDGDLVVGGFADGSVVGWLITDGSVRWRTLVGTRPNQILVASGRVFIAGQDGRLISLRQRNGQMEWDYEYRMPIVGRLAADDKRIYASTVDNAVRAHAFNGNQRWRMLAASRIVDGLFVDAGSVFAPLSSGEIRMFLADGGTRSGRLVPPVAASNVTGALVAAGTGQDLRMAITTSSGANRTVTTYRRAGLDAVVATTAPAGAPLVLAPPGGRH